MNNWRRGNSTDGQKRKLILESCCAVRSLQCKSNCYSHKQEPTWKIDRYVFIEPCEKKTFWFFTHSFILVLYLAAGKPMQKNNVCISSYKKSQLFYTQGKATMYCACL